MRVLIDICHPAQIHFFKHLIARLQNRGDEVLVTARDKDVVKPLLSLCNAQYELLTTASSGLFGLGREFLIRNWRLSRIVGRFRPDIMMAESGAIIGLVGALRRVPRIVLEFSEHAKLQRALGLPFATRILTGTGYQSVHGRRHRKFKGIWVSAYLCPERFQANASILGSAGVDPGSRYTLIRTVSWNAAHDVGHGDASQEGLRRVVNHLQKYGRVFLVPEGDLPNWAEECRLPVDAKDVHHLLAFASLYLGEGGTMAAEAAVLGVPTIYTGIRTGFLDALQSRYRLIEYAESLDGALPKADDLLSNPRWREEWADRRNTLLDESEDIVAFLENSIDEVMDGNSTRSKVSVFSAM